MRTRVTVLAAVAVFPLVVALVAVVATRGGDEDLVKLPVGSWGAMPADAADAAASTAARSELLAPERGAVEYRLAGPLPDLPSTAPAYRLASATTAAEVGRLAAALRLDGAVAQQGGAWVVRDGERELRVEPVPGLPWYLGSACAEAPVSSDDASVSVSVAKQCAVAGVARVEAPAVDGGVARPEAAPKPPRPADLPSREDAERLARDTFTRLGVGLHGLAVEDRWLAWEALVEPLVDGLEVLGLGPSLSIGPGGRIERANGFLAKPERIGDYPLAGLEEGLQRLRRNAGVGPRPLPVEDCSKPTVTCEPPPDVGVPTPDPVARPVVGAHLAVFQVDAVVVPVYVFELDGGEETFPVPAVTDEWLEQQPSVQRQR